MEKLLQEKKQTEIELRGLKNKIEKREIKSDDAEKQLLELRQRKSEIEKQIALQKQPVTDGKETNTFYRDLASAMQKRETVTLGGTGVTNTIRDLTKVMSTKKDVLNRVKYFYGENAQTVIPIWGKLAKRPTPVTGVNINLEEDNNLGNTTLQVKPYATSVAVSNETLKLSAVDFESELKEIMADAFADAMAYQIFNGDGKSGNFENVFTGNEEIATATATPKIADLSTLALTLADKTDSGVIYLHPSVYNKIIADTTDTQKVYREDLIRNKTIETVPVILTSYQPSDMATGKPIAVAGDFANYAVAVAGELTMEAKKQPKTLATVYDVSMYLAGKPAVAKNFYTLKVK